LHERNERIPQHQVARLLKALTDALDYAHSQGVIHRDIKPGNIILHNRTEAIPLDQPLVNGVEAIITDFGLVRIINATTQTASGMVSGTPAYMSPEQARGDKTDHRTDIYSLGVVLYEMLAGRVPFEADSTMAVIYMHIHTPPPPIPELPVDVQAVLDRALSKNPNERYQTSREMAVDFFRSIGMTAEARTIQDPFPAVSKAVERTETEAPAKPESVIRPAPKRMWVTVGLFSFICLLALGVGAWGLSSFLPQRSTPTALPILFRHFQSLTLEVSPLAREW
jgi:serine/threonine protein kinase